MVPSPLFAGPARPDGRSRSRVLLRRVAAATLLAAVLTPASPAGAQAAPDATPAPVEFPAPLVGAVPAPTTKPAPELDVIGVYRENRNDPERSELVVRFAAPFALPATDYRVAVAVGDPAGERFSAALVSRAPAGGTRSAPTGSLLRYDGAAWQDAGGTDVTFDAAGLVRITLPLTGLPTGRALWVEIGDGDPDAPRWRSPYFSRTALLGGAPAGALPGTETARLDGASGAGRSKPVLLPDVPMVTLHQRLLVVGSGGPAPDTIDDQRVDRIEDRIRLAPGFGEVDRPAEVRVDWDKGQVSLLDGSSPPVDLSGERAWMRFRYPAEGSLRPDAIELDLDAVATALGVPLDPARFAVGVTRLVHLTDGRVARAEGVLATARWFDPAPLASATGTGEPEAIAPGSAEPALTGWAAVEDRLRRTDRQVLTAASAGAAVLLLILLMLARRRRRRRRAEVAVFAGERLPWDRADAALTHEAERKVMASVLASMPPDESGAADPLAHDDVKLSRRNRRRARREMKRLRSVIDIDALEAARPAALEEGPARPGDQGVPSDLPRRVAAGPAPSAAADGADRSDVPVVEGARTDAPRAGERLAPQDFLAALDGDLSAFKGRLDRLDQS